jgi:hypothetical protein
MLRLTLDETAPSGQHARSAHIAAMGQRLAAAGPRTRQKVTKRYHPSADTGDNVAAPALPPAAEPIPILVADRSHAFMRNVAPIVPPSSRSRVVTAIGRAAAIGVMASAGFALVLVAQSPRWSVARHSSAKIPSPVVVAKSEPEQPATPASPAVRAHIAEQDWGKGSQPPFSARPAALPPKTAPAAAPAPAPPATRPARPIPVQLAAVHRTRKEALRPMHEANRHEASRPAMLAHYELPRWLTEERPSQPHAITMSPPPHDLEVPAAQQASAVPVEKPRFSLPPLPRPRLIYASAAYPPPSYRPPPPYGYYQPYPP